MFKLIKKLISYTFLILLALEVLIRVFHLHNELPERYAAEDGILKWVPNQQGYSVHGNRRQNFAEYHINSSGYNSYREFSPSDEKFEIAIIGDSYIEGFHQNYHNSIGKKIEDQVDGVEVFEYGHSSNDLADQLYLIKSNEEKFEKIDHIIMYLKYENDLLRSEYHFVQRTPLFPLIRYSKLVVYLLNIGMADPIKNVHRRLGSIKGKVVGNAQTVNKAEVKVDQDSLYLENFKSLAFKYGFDKKKMSLLLDSRVTDKKFMEYLDKEGIDVIDFSDAFEASGGMRKTTLIYDLHWNDYGREVIAAEILEHLNSKMDLK